MTRRERERVIKEKTLMTRCERETVGERERGVDMNPREWNLLNPQSV